ncbi:MAG TPA: hypothetical protein VKV04_14235 [Verrucomicrobiae bacterium]|nr:hypothetical protein [Verrucomicrobiae bacterium]
MNKDAPATPANELDSDIITTIARRKFCLVTLIFGATVGVLIGILNLLAVLKEWTLQDDFFDIIDAPITSLMSAPAGLLWIFNALKLAFVLICYWAAIALFLASLPCLFRAGVIRDMTREKICKYILFFGTCGGIFVGSLGFLAASNGWEDFDNLFNFLNQPVNSVVDALQDKYNIQDFLPSDPRAEFILRNTVAVVYWTVISSLVALLACVVRILKKRKAAREREVVRGMAVLCLTGVSE